MKFQFNENTTISRLSIPSHGDQLAARLRYARLFGGMDLRPASIPPNSIVCIKKIRNTRPQTSGSFKTEWEFSEKWKNSILNEIENLYRRAYRPVNESVPASAEVVVFSDRAELLACLTDDWRKENLFQNWWWKSLFPHLKNSQSIVYILAESAEFIPRALEILVKKKSVIDFAKKLQPDETVELTKKIVEIFGLNKLRKVLFEPLTLREKTELREKYKKSEKYAADKVLEKRQPPAEIIYEFVPEIRNQNSSFETKVFLGIGLMLARAPRILRTETFAERIGKLKIENEFFSEKKSRKVETVSQTLIESEKVRHISDRKSDAKNEKKSDSKTFKLNPETKITREEKKRIVFHERKTEGEISTPTKEISPVFKEEKQSSKLEVKTKEVHFESHKTGEISEVKREKSDTKIFQAKEEKTFAENSESVIESDETDFFETIIRTNLGGVFYLLNLGLYLKLYRDFSEPLGEEIELNIWDFVALSSLEFLGAKIKTDAVWNLLKQLAGREIEDEFPADFPVSNEWQMPKEWLTTFPKNEKWLWAKTENRLIVRHSEKFNVLDVQLKNEDQFENESENFKEYFSEIKEAKIESFYEKFAPAESWFKNFYEFAERRLLQALNLENRKQLNASLFERSATIAVSATHFKATFNLADLPLAVRFSGLDRNPGWIPAAGKYVEFYFV